MEFVINKDWLKNIKSYLESCHLSHHKAVVLASHYFIYNIGKKEGLQSYLEKELGRKIDSNKKTRCACDAIETIDAVMTVLKESDSLYSIIDKSILMGGDTESVASIACGIASQSSEFNQDLPDFMYSDLENNTYGKDYLMTLDKLLFEKFILIPSNELSI